MPASGVISRRRRRRELTRPLFGLIAIVAVSAFALFSYRVGRSQAEVEVARLESEIEALHERIGALAAQAAAAEQREGRAVDRRRELERAYGRNVPRGALRELTKLAQLRMDQGMPADRLEFLLRNASIERACVERVETASIAPRTPESTSLLETATFADGRINVTAQGTAVLPPEDAPRGEPGARPAGEGEQPRAPSFDPRAPVQLRFMRLGGSIDVVDGVLPLGHRMVVDGREYRFSIVPARDRGRIDVTTQECAFP